MRLKLRNGQRALVQHLEDTDPDSVVVHWPTGYGKSIGMALAWRYYVTAGAVDRLMIVVANDIQRTQILNDFAGDCRLVDAPCEGGVWDFRRKSGDVEVSLRGDVQIFVVTIQQLCASAKGGANTIGDLMSQNEWLVCFDELHHVSREREWKKGVALAFSGAKRWTAWSATPFRVDGEDFFGPPDLTETYRNAFREHAVKGLERHTYNYNVEVQHGSEAAMAYTTKDLKGKGNLPEGVSPAVERRQLRVNSGYIEPLLMNPLSRLNNRRMASGGRALQMLIRAMDCAHAEDLVRDVRQWKGWSVDWIAHTRTADENSAVIARFCPPKDEDGIRPEPELDILVQVAMAGEGFDSINVIEIIDFFPCSTNGTGTNQDRQFYGRGTRVIPGLRGDNTLCISVPTDHPLDNVPTSEMQKWMDGEEVDAKAPNEEEEEEYKDDPTDPNAEWDPLPEQIPYKRTATLIEIDRGDSLFKNFCQEVDKTMQPLGVTISDDQKESWLREALTGRAEKQSTRDAVRCKRIYLNEIVKRCARVMTIKADLGMERFRREFPKNIKRLNAELIGLIGRQRDNASTNELERCIVWVTRYYEGIR